MPGRPTGVALGATLALLTGGAAALFFLIPRAALWSESEQAHDMPYGCPRAPLLAPGSTPLLTLGPGESQIFRIHRNRGQVLEAVVDQKGVDVVVHLWSPRGGKLLRVDGSNGAWGPEPVFAVAGERGSYCLEIELNHNVRPAGGFRVRVEPRRRARSLDRSRASGHHAFSVAEQLRRDQKFADALPFYEAAVHDFRTVGERERLGSALYHLGDVHEQLGEYSKAAPRFADAMAAFTGTSDEAMAGNRLGSVYEALGDNDSAFAAFRRSQAIARSFNDRGREAGSLVNRGRLHQNLGEFDEALKAFTEAFEVWRASDNFHEQALVLNDLADFYLDVGRPADARESARAAIQLEQGRDETPLEIGSRRSLGMALLRLGDVAGAIEELGRSRSLARQLGIRWAEASALLYLGESHLQEKDLSLAQEAYQTALGLTRGTGILQLEANAYEGLGEVHRLTGDLRTALLDLQKARSLYVRHGDRDSEALALELQARVLGQQGRLAEAQRLLDQALPILESLRTRPGSSDLRSSFFGSRFSAYELDMDLLVALNKLEPGRGHDAEAFTVSERSRARTVLEELAEAQTPSRSGVPSELLLRFSEVEHRLSSLEKESRASDAEFQALRAKRDEIKAEIRAAHPAEAMTQTLSLSEVQNQLLDDDTALLAYTLGEQHSLLWLIRRSSSELRELRPRQSIEGLAREALESLSATNSRRSRNRQVEIVTELAQALLGPIADEPLPKRLLVVADGALQYIPFAVLPLQGRSLIADHEIVNLPSASVLAALRRETEHRASPPKAVAVVADPVFRRDDERFPASLRLPSVAPQLGPLGDVERSARDLGIDGFDRLKFAGLEARSILQLAPPGQSLAALGFDADRRHVLDADLGRYRIVHFATHAVFDTLHPELSGIVLSLLDREGRPQDGYLRAYEVYNLKLPVDLVVLSACRTALGPEIRGEGLGVLTRGFMYAGAPRVLVSLWNVSDKGTAHLMELFYQGVLKQGLRPAEALRQAQEKMLESHDWSSPYYWAGFVLEGEWR